MKILIEKDQRSGSKGILLDKNAVFSIKANLICSKDELELIGKYPQIKLKDLFDYQNLNQKVQTLNVWDLINGFKCESENIEMMLGIEESLKSSLSIIMEYINECLGFGGTIEAEYE